MIKRLRPRDPFNRGHHLILDGDMLGISPDMIASEVMHKVCAQLKIRDMVSYSHKVNIAIGEKLYILKDREFGHCDFRRS